MNFEDLIKSDTSNQDRMYRDDVIYVKAPKGHFRKTFKRLERDTGLDFKFTRSSRKAEIICEFDQLTNWAGWAETMGKGRYKLTVEPQHWYTESVVVHEIGHALGLGHVDGKKSIMSYDRNYRTTYFMPADLHAIAHVFDLDHRAADFY